MQSGDYLPGDTGEEIGTKGCLKMNDGELLAEETEIFHYWSLNLVI